MESKVKVPGHPVHPMLIVFPLGLLATSVIFDVISDTIQSKVVVNGLVHDWGWHCRWAACCGFRPYYDWLAIRANSAKSIGLWHGGLNVLVVLVLLAAFWYGGPILQIQAARPWLFPLWLS